jgi:hypothetical protein
MSNGASDDMLPPSEATDSDELRNDAGDEVVEAPDHWQGVDDAALSEPADQESLDDKLAAEEPDAGISRPPKSVDEAVEDAEASRHRGQVGGSPEDGDSFFPIED